MCRLAGSIHSWSALAALESERCQSAVDCNAARSQVARLDLQLEDAAAKLAQRSKLLGPLESASGASSPLWLNLGGLALCCSLHVNADAPSLVTPRAMSG
ncbi:unnamed protein product [Lampetra fluviatilis]